MTTCWRRKEKSIFILAIEATLPSGLYVESNIIAKHLELFGEHIVFDPGTNGMPASNAR